VKRDGDQARIKDYDVKPEEEGERKKFTYFYTK